MCTYCRKTATDGEVLGLAAISAILFSIMGLLIGWVIWDSPDQPKAPKLVAQDTTGCIKVKILERAVNPEGKVWYLLETEDGQRCHIDFYRGKIGERFAIHPSKLNGYFPPKPVEIAKEQTLVEDIPVLSDSRTVILDLPHPKPKE